MLITDMLENYMVDLCFMNRRRIPDGAGSYVTRWEESAPFKAVQKHDQTIEAQIAEKSDTASTYTFIVDKNIRVDDMDRLKRIKDGMIFIVTEGTGAKHSPAESALDMAIFKAKKGVLEE